MPTDFRTPPSILCKDCRHLHLLDCAIPVFDPVSGKEGVVGASDARLNPILCGPDAKWFEPKERG
jgi:hypothetical protein